MHENPGYRALQRKVEELERDLAKREHVEHDLQESLRELTFLDTLANRVSNSLSIRQVARSAVEGIFQLLDMDLNP